MDKHLKVFLICFFIVGFNHSAHAQAYYSDVTLKESLVNILYQYGKETFYRGLEPQEASFIFQRILVLNCSHQGAQAFLDKIHHQYPDVSIKIWGCSEVKKGSDSSNDTKKQEAVASVGNESFVEAPAADDQTVTNDLAVSEIEDDQLPSEMPQVIDVKASSVEVSQDSVALRQSYQKLQEELAQLENKAKEKDSVISDDQHQLSADKDDQPASYEAIAQDQKDLIRIQQSNIDYLKSELEEAKKNEAAGTVVDSDEKYGVMHQEIAGTVLTAQEKQMDLSAKNDEVKTLRVQLEDLEGQLRLVQEIVNQKNVMIKSLEEEIKAVKPVVKQ